ncbi:MAG: hypothetical protein WDM96_14755 [Lacunisphaera sp.]
MSHRAEHPLFRFTALLAVLCVLVLTVLAASPELHARLHAAGLEQADQSAPVGDADHVCAVTLFANGLLALALFCLMLLIAPLVRRSLVRAGDEIAAARPHYRLLPAQAPPVA